MKRDIYLRLVYFVVGRLTLLCIWWTMLLAHNVQHVWKSTRNVVLLLDNSNARGLL